MGKIKETQEKVAVTKKRMDTVLVDEKSSDSLLSVTVTASRQVKNIAIDPALLEDQEQLEDYLVTTLNKALSKAETIYETELAAVAKEGMPNIPGMDMFQ